MKREIFPNWLEELEDEDLSFIRNFLLASGSLKEIASIYNVTYPTVRLRLDKLIQKINMAEKSESDSYIQLIKKIALNDKIDFDTAKLLINEYKNCKQKGL